MIAPHAGDLVEQRLHRMRILEHVDDGEIRYDVQRHQRRERRGHEQQLRQRGGARDIHQGGIAPARAEHRHGGLDQRQRQRQHQRVMSGFRDHRDAPLRRRGARRGSTRLGAVVVLPVALLLQRVGDILGHVGLVMLGQHGIGLEHAGGIERAFGDDALPFAEQVGQNSLVGDRQRGAAVGDLKFTARLSPRTSEPGCTRPPRRKRLPGGICFSADHRRRREEHDGVAHRVQHQRRRNREHRERTADHGQTPLLARHRISSCLRSLAFGASCLSIEPEILCRPSLSWRKRSASLATAWRASTERARRLVALAHHHIGPHQPQPSLDIVAVLLQPGGEPLDHAADHGAAVGFVHVLGGGHRRRWTAPARAATADPRQRRLHQRPPRRIRRRLRQHARARSRPRQRRGRPARRQARGNSSP